MRGVKTITIHTSTHDTRRATLAVTVCVDGTKLPQIFKDKQNTRIAAKEFPTFLMSCEYFCQKNAWMDEDTILEWVENIFKSFIATAPGNISPLLVLDSYRCQIMASVIKLIKYVSYITISNHIHWINYLLFLILKYFYCFICIVFNLTHLLLHLFYLPLLTFWPLHCIIVSYQMLYCNMFNSILFKSFYIFLF